MDPVTLIKVVGTIASLVTGKPATIDYSIKDAIIEVERMVGQSLPEAWEYWGKYEGCTREGNERFFIWDKRTKWAEAQGAIEALQGYLKKVIADYEAEEKRKAAEEAIKVTAKVTPSYLPLLAILGILVLGLGKGK